MASGGYDQPMKSLSDTVVIFFVLAVVFLSLWIGLRVGNRTRLRGNLDMGNLGTIQAAILGLLALVLGFSFSGAMNRFIDRQDALAAEANAIGDAYDRAELIPTTDLVQQSIREYAELRLRLFYEDRSEQSAELEARMLGCYESARIAVYEGVRTTPQFGLLAISGIESVQNEFTRRSAFERRDLPSELIFVLIVSSGVSMGVIGYGVGLAERRSTGSAVALASLVAMTLFLTIDFDRPRRGFIALDVSPLENVVRLTAGTPGRP